MTLPVNEVWADFVCWYQRTAALLIVLVGGGVAAFSWLRPHSEMAQSTSFAVIYFTACGLAAAWIWGLSTRMTRRAILLSFTVVACFLGLSQATLMVNLRQRYSEDAGQVVATMKQQIPADAEFVSLGQAHHLFLFHLRKPVRLLKHNEDDPAAWGDAQYFCVWTKGADLPQLDFSWEPVATISCDRNRSGRATEVTIVGRRKPVVTATAVSSPPSRF